MMLAFVFSPVGRIVAMAAVVAILTGGSYLKGRAHCAAKWQVANLRAELATVRADVAAAKAAEEAASRQASDLEATAQRNAARADDLARKLGAVPERKACALTPGQARALGAIR